MERAQVVQGILALFPAPSYLEIGVDYGETFRSLRAARKVAVDPQFKFTPPSDTPEVSYYPVTSDAYFSRPGPSFDVAYVDGLHTVEQVLRDILNAAARLTRTGVIVVDDILPNSYHAGLPDLGEALRVRDHLAQWTPALAHDLTWMGDVYKVVFFVRSFLQAFSYAVMAENHGQLVLWREPRDMDGFAKDSLRALGFIEFRDTVLRRDAFNIRPMAEILERIVASRRAAG